jgi:hypothetical protein
MKITTVLTRTIISLTVTASVLVAGCAGELSVEELLDNTERAMEQLETYRMELTGTNYDQEETSEMQAVFEVVPPDKMRMVQTLPEPSESVLIGRTQYELNSRGFWNVRKWPVGFQNPDYATGYAAMLKDVKGIEKLDDEKVDGVSCLHYRGYIDMAARAEEEEEELDPEDPNYEARLESLEVYRDWEFEVEFWIGKDDYLLRKLSQTQEITLTSESNDEIEKVHQKIETEFRIYGFDEPILFSSPPANLVQGVNLKIFAIDSIGGEEKKAQEIEYFVTITNDGNEAADELRVFIDTGATNNGQTTLEAKADTSPVRLATEEVTAFRVSWEYDITDSSKEELTELMEGNVIRVTWKDPGGRIQEEELTMSEVSHERE